MRKPLKSVVAIVVGALLSTPGAAQRRKIDSCPGPCSSSTSPLDWSAYHNIDHLSACTEPMLLDFSLYNPLNATDASWTFLACQPGEDDSSAQVERRADSSIEHEEVKLPLQLASWDTTTRAIQDKESISTLVENIRAWLADSSPDGQFHILGRFDDVAAGLYIGPRYERSSAVDAIVKVLLDESAESSGALTVVQHCGSRGEDTLGIVLSTNGDLHAIQQTLRGWRDGECPGDYDESKSVSDITISASPSTLAISSLHRRTLPLPSLLQPRAATCKIINVVLGDGCPSLAERCGISGADFEKYNDIPNLCSTLAEGQPVCCTEGDLPDFSPDPYENGTCYTHRVNTGEYCSTLAAMYTLTIDDIESFNEDTWGWLGCGDLQAGLNICLSSGTPPFPAPITDAICGPQVLGTKQPDDSTPSEWALLNQCPLNACCNLWGWCGINPEFCERKESATGNPGTTLCVSNCGMSVVNDDIPPDEFAKVGYFLASNLNRECLTMNAYSIRTNDYTHIQYAFGNIGDDFSIGLMEGEEEQFAYFKRMTAVKRVISFGGWDFSTFPETYHIFRNGVKEENRETFARNVVDFVNEHGLDGVDFDWEYPGAPDLPDIPVGEEEEGERYLEFLKLVREYLPDGKSLSIAAPASFWYLKAFPISEIGALVDYIVYMTYDLRGQWDYESNDPPLGCPDGNCLRSHVNSTETQYALAMITKALVQTRKILVGVSSYGRAFEMSVPGCTGPTCTFTGNGAAQGRCTKTSGYLANAEINEILDLNGNAVHSYDSDSDSDILVYDTNQWAAYMTDETRNRRLDKYSGMNMGGSVEWSIDLQKFNPGIVPSPGIFLPLPEDMDIEEFCSEPDFDEITEADASSQRNVSAYFDYFFKEARGGSTSNWAQELFGDTQVVTCDVYPEGQCNFPIPSTCKEMESPSLYWARYAVANFFQHIVQYGAMFEASTINSTLNIGSLVSDFPIKVPDTTSMETVFGIFAGALGLAGSAASGHVGNPASPGVGAALAAFGGMWSIVAAAVKDEEPPDENDLERALYAQLGIIWNAGYKGAGKTLVAVFGDGDLDEFPSDLKDGDWEFQISNFFDGRWLAKLRGDEVGNIQEALGENMMKSLAASTLSLANYYIMKDGFDADECSDQTGGKVIDGTCYTLEYPGDGDSAAVPKRSDFSKPVESATLKLIEEKYSISLEDLYRISESCQSATKDYGGAIASDVYKLFGDDEKPGCFYALPVFFANTEGISDQVSWRTPCWARVSNMTAGDGDTPVVGETYLPPNLDKVFAVDFCVPCYGGSPSCNAG